MGNSFSKIYDDIDDYKSLCEKYGEKVDEVYSTHYYWVNEKDNGETVMSFKEYKNKDKIAELQIEIKLKEAELLKLKKELIEYMTSK